MPVILDSKETVIGDTIAMPALVTGQTVVYFAWDDSGTITEIILPAGVEQGDTPYASSRNALTVGYVSGPAAATSHTFTNAATVYAVSVSNCFGVGQVHLEGTGSVLPVPFLDLSLPTTPEAQGIRFVAARTGTEIWDSLPNAEIIESAGSTTAAASLVLETLDAAETFSTTSARWVAASVILFAYPEGSAPIVVPPAPTGVYAEEMQDAIDDIEEAGGSFTFQRDNQTIDDPDKPWRKTAGVAETFVAACVMTKFKKSQQSQGFTAGSEDTAFVLPGDMILLLAAANPAITFTPAARDIVDTPEGHGRYNVVDVFAVAPNGEPILYKVWIRK